MQYRRRVPVPGKNHGRLFESAFRFYRRPGRRCGALQWRCNTPQQGYGLDDAAKLFCVVDHTEKIEYQVPTLKALQTWVQAAHGNEE